MMTRATTIGAWCVGRGRHERLMYSRYLHLYTPLQACTVRNYTYIFISISPPIHTPEGLCNYTYIFISMSPPIHTPAGMHNYTYIFISISPPIHTPAGLCNYTYIFISMSPPIHTPAGMHNYTYILSWYLHLYTPLRACLPGEICPCCHCQRQSKVFASGVNFSRSTRFTI